MFEDVVIDGWKGKSGLIVSEDSGADFRIVENRKSKESGEVYCNEHLISRKSVSILWKLISDRCEVNFEYKYKFLVRMVIEAYRIDKEEGVPLDFMISAFNGGKYRALYYFPLLYYPLKVLESKGVIVYLGRGGIVRLCDRCVL